MAQITSFTSESVCAGHPDKVADQISDAILDAVLTQDPNGRVALETMAAWGHLTLAGEVTTTAKIDFEAVARAEIKRLGYTNPDWGFSDQSPINSFVHEQSVEIAAGVDEAGAGDQGMMFGYACNETPELMPMPITLAHRLTQKIDSTRESKQLAYLRPDGKSQVTVEYKDGKPHKVTHVVVAVPHSEDVDHDTVKKDIYEQIITPVLAEYGFEVAIKDVVLNGTGIWHMPGPGSDAGLTGRKIVVDGYGGYARVGGGAFSGKDPTKVDRSGAYAARYLAKNIVAKGLADQAEVGMAYFIGAKQPIWRQVETFGTAKASEAEIQAYMDSLLSLSVTGIIDGLDLKRPIYRETAAYGHFGRPEFPWEQVKTS